MPKSNMSNKLTKQFDATKDKMSTLSVEHLDALRKQILNIIAEIGFDIILQAKKKYDLYVSEPEKAHPASLKIELTDSDLLKILYFKGIWSKDEDLWGYLKDVVVSSLQQHNFSGIPMEATANLWWYKEPKTAKKEQAYHRNTNFTFEWGVLGGKEEADTEDYEISIKTKKPKAKRTEVYEQLLTLIPQFQRQVQIFNKLNETSYWDTRDARKKANEQQGDKTEADAVSDMLAEKHKELFGDKSASKHCRMM